MQSEDYLEIKDRDKEILILMEQDVFLEYYLNKSSGITAMYPLQKNTKFTGNVLNGKIMNWKCTDPVLPLEDLTETSLKNLRDYSNYRIERRIVKGMPHNVVLGLSYKDGNFDIGYYRDYDCIPYTRDFYLYLNNANGSNYWKRCRVNLEEVILFAMRDEGRGIEPLNFFIE
jgi:hypothetical protein